MVLDLGWDTVSRKTLRVGVLSPRAGVITAGGEMGVRFCEKGSRTKSVIQGLRRASSFRIRAQATWRTAHIQKVRKVLVLRFGACPITEGSVPACKRGGQMKSHQPATPTVDTQRFTNSRPQEVLVPPGPSDPCRKLTCW